MSIPCWCRSSEVKGTASSSNFGWEKERVDRGSKENPAVRKTCEDHASEFNAGKLTGHIPRTRMVA